MKIILIIIVFASINNTAYILDFAIIYTLFGFIGVIFTANFLLERVKERGR
ncbi:MAG: monovalent cation/H+ antiporter complex subunit F [Treponema sp.]|nr:monovalent cation/H+ antiporter complex subunit F [Treponema sp.]